MTTRLRSLEHADAEALHGLVRAAEAADRIPIATPLEEIEELFDEALFDPARDGRVAVGRSGEPLGWGRIWHHPSGERLERAFLFGTVHPDHRRRGIGSAILCWQLDRAREILGAYDHDLPRFIRTNAYDWQEDAHRLYARHGLRQVRWHQELMRSLADLPSPAPPPGVDIAPWADHHRSTALAVTNAAFADHWGSTPRSEESWSQRLTSHGVRLDLSFVAVVDGAVVGLLLAGHYPSDEAVTGRRDGWIETLAVLREWRRRGVASALIARSLAAFAGVGLTHALLDVDSDNPTGAARLYRSLGFDPLHSTITSELAVD
jgi:ribosomal protein S18 acetylase RimI-like enzyme